jgi:hypothetical protein
MGDGWETLAIVEKPALPFCGDISGRATTHEQRRWQYFLLVICVIFYFLVLTFGFRNVWSVLWK